jgi:hypothetical protein
MSLLRTLAQHTRTGEPRHAGPLTVIPLFGPTTPHPDYLTLAQALAANLVTITEVSDAGSVPVLRAKNQGPRPVLLVDGEELIGAKQNRIMNLTILLPPHRLTDIPVSCVEQGRWNYRGRQFAASDNTLYPSARSRKVAEVSASIRQGSRSADQSALWDRIEAKRGRLGTASSTGAMKDLYDSQSQSIQGFLNAIAGEKGQTGAAFGINGEIHGVELFDSPATFAEYFPKLIRSWGMDAIELTAKAQKPSEAWQASAVLARLAESPIESFPALGLGEDLRFGYQHTPAAALAYEGRVVHLVGFTV